MYRKLLKTLEPFIEQARFIQSDEVGYLTKGDWDKLIVHYNQLVQTVETDNKPTDRGRMIHAWRTLYYGGLLNEKEKTNIAKKLNNRYPDNAKEKQTNKGYRK